MIQIGIDLGANSIRLISLNDGIIFDEPCMIALDEHNHVLAIGREAFEMKGLESNSVRVVSPISNTRVDIAALTLLLEQLCDQFKIFRFLTKTTVLFSYPTSLSNEGCEQIKNALLDLGASKVYYDREIWFAAIGSRLDLSLPVASCVMNIGYSNCDIAIFQEGDIKQYSRGPFAGIQIGQLIRNWLKKSHNITVTEATLEDIVRTLGTVIQETDPLHVTIQGSNTQTHTLTTMTLSGNEIAFLLAPLVNDLAQWILGFLASVPIETQKDILLRGIVCSGGSMTLTGLPKKLQELIGCPVYLTDHPLYTITSGLEIVLDQMD